MPKPTFDNIAMAPMSTQSSPDSSYEDNTVDIKCRPHSFYQLYNFGKSKRTKSRRRGERRSNPAGPPASKHHEAIWFNPYQELLQAINHRRPHRNSSVHSWLSRAFNALPEGASHFGLNCLNNVANPGTYLYRQILPDEDYLDAKF
ncbi:hypothetical protein H2203_006792 [Taxawa tesnikishii (nom. ined.)]|nr:hypothetical protein H2203_006792 [Dothideales sp. JES 119]